MAAHDRLIITAICPSLCFRSVCLTAHACGVEGLLIGCGRGVATENNSKKKKKEKKYSRSSGSATAVIRLLPLAFITESLMSRHCFTK